MDEALRTQCQRGAFLRDHLRKIGDRAYDTDTALLKRWNPFFPRFNGHTIGQQSLEYAILLLHSDDRTYGTDDAGEANRIIQKILEHQDLAPTSESFGNFYWMTHWDRVKDRNAVSFLCAGLVYAYLNFPEKLSEETRSKLAKAFPDMLVGIRKHKVRWQYTNIYFLNLGGLVSLACVLGDASIHDEAVADFDTWLEGTAHDGFHEFNSPTYTPVTLFGMEAAWANTPDENFKKRLHRTMDLITYQIALNLSPTGFLAGPAARAYQNDAIYGTGWAAVYAHIKFGTPCPPLKEADIPITYANNTLFDYIPPKPVRDLAHKKADYAEIHDRGLSLNSRRTHIITPNFSLGSQTLERPGGHSPPSYILLVRNVESNRKSIPFLPDESFTHQPCATFESRQMGTRVIGRLHYELEEDQQQRFLDDPTYLCEPRILFGLRPEIHQVRIGNVDWGGRNVRPLPGQSIALAYNNLFLGIIAQPINTTSNCLHLSYGDDSELRLYINIHGGPNLKPTDTPTDVLIYFEACTPTTSFEDYADHLANWQLSATEEHTFSATHPDGTPIAYPPSNSDPDPIGNALHISPVLTLHPGDLIPLVNENDPLPFV
ncbi:MAG: hypothetical protein QGG64_09765 [Candidatus Latescibacteria bacterium]|jgi:hypothetical protein|nr:hypothetical protein [Candidatus Latescibacterota bacterium]